MFLLSILSDVGGGGAGWVFTWMETIEEGGVDGWDVDGE